MRYKTLGILLGLLLPVVALATYIVPQGGTGQTNIQAGGIVYGNGTGAIATTSQGTGGFVLSWLNGIPTWTSTSSILGSWATTSTNYWLTQQPLGLFFSTTSSNYAVGASIAGTTTTALAEGTNLYFTNARAVSALAGLYEVPLTFIAPLFRTANSISWFGLATTSQPASSNILVSNGTNGVFGVATTTATCTGTVTCAVHTVIGASPVTINGSGAASSTLLGDNNTFSGTNIFSNALSTFAGLAANATKLVTPRAINGVNFDGSAAITINAASSTLLANNNTWTGINGFQTLSFTNGTGTNATTTNSYFSPNIFGTLGQFATINATSTTGTSTFLGAMVNANGNTVTVSASYVVSTTTKTGDFTDVQSAINALPSTGGLIHVKCGTYTLPAGVNGIAPKVGGTIIEGEGACTQFNFDQALTTNAIQPNTSNLANIVLRNFYIHQTNATFGGIGINASNTPLLIARSIKIDGTATSTSIKDTKNLSFYQIWENLDLRDNTSCVDIGGNPVNDNSFKSVRCGLHSGNNGFAYYIDSNSSNGAQGNIFDHINSEPTGAATGLTGIYCANCVDNQFIGAYIEGNGTGWNLTANAQRNTFHGGEFLINTTYTNSGTNNQWLGVDKENNAYNLIMSSTTIADVSGSDASVPSLSFIGNTNFAKASQIINMIFSNSTDSGDGLKITNPGSGNSINVVSGKSILQAFTFTNATGTGATTTTHYSNIFTGDRAVFGTSTASTTIYGNSTSTFAGGVNLSNGGCFSIAGICIGSGLTLGIETPTGTINNSNKVFTTVFNPKMVHLNGVYQSAGGNDYTLTGSGPYTITFLTAPTNGSTIETVYTVAGSGGGAITRVITSISTPQTAGGLPLVDYVYLVSGVTTLTLPTAVGNTNRYSVKNSGVNTVTVATTGGQTIDGSATASLPTANSSIDIVSNGSNWFII